MDEVQHQLATYLPAHQPFGVLEVMLAPRGARLENAWAKCQTRSHALRRSASTKRVIGEGNK